MATFSAGIDAEAFCRRLSQATSRLVVLASMLALSKTAVMADTFRIHGSTTFNRIIVEPFSATIEQTSGHRLVVVPNKSLNGVIDLLEGRADLAMISSSLSVELKALGAARPSLDGSRLVAHQIAETRVAFAIHPQNPVRKISPEEMVRVLSGGIKNWSELGGPPANIRTSYVRSAGGVTSAVVDIVMKGQPLKPAHAVPVDSPVQVAKIVSQEPSALGLAQLRLVKDMGLAELTTGSPVVQTLVIVTVGPPSRPMESLIQAIRNVADKKLTMAH